MTDETYLSVEEASELTNVKRSTLYKLAREGKCPAYKVPGTKMLRFPKSKLLEWMESDPAHKPGEGE